MRKNLIVSSVIITLLTAAFLTALFLNKSGIEARRNLMENSTLEIRLEGDNTLVGFDMIQSLGFEDFKATLDTSSTDAAIFDYSGVQLIDLLEHIGYLVDKEDVIIATGVDGFSVAYSGDEVLKDGAIYIAVLEDGKYLGGIEDGGRGPYEIIVVNDPFSNRRCKWLTRIEVSR